MINSNSKLDRKIDNYINKLFAEVGESQQLFDLKEELHTNLKEKIADYKSQGMEEEQAFKEATVSMGDLSGLVEEMREIGRDKTKQTIYTSMANRISTAGIVVGTLLILFGILVSLLLYAMGNPLESVAGSTIFVVFGGAFLTYSALTRETQKKFGMNKVRALLYAVSIGLLLFAGLASATSGFATQESFIAVASLIPFVLSGVGLFLALIFTGQPRRKH
ncbi:permease prefix domain 1-containing protein [Alteribacillus sp. HJP-4]|uniref:permease prefix domain 1-containing protein n=1 Tax=Alteribacillus sp. HJP-4 TaxID=2775394 RepID=UPI0035CD08E9